MNVYRFYALRPLAIVVILSCNLDVIRVDDINIGVVYNFGQIAVNYNRIQATLYPKNNARFCMGQHRITYYQLPLMDYYALRSDMENVRKTIVDKKTLLITGELNEHVAAIVNTPISTNSSRLKHVYYSPLFTPPLRTILHAVHQLWISRFVHNNGTLFAVIEEFLMNYYYYELFSIMSMLFPDLTIITYSNNAANIIDVIKKQKIRNILVIASPQKTELLILEADRVLALDYKYRWMLVLSRLIYNKVLVDKLQLYNKNIVSVDYLDPHEHSAVKANSTEDTLITDAVHLIQSQLYYIMCNKTPTRNPTWFAGNYQMDKHEVTRLSWKLRYFEGLWSGSKKTDIGYYINDKVFRPPLRLPVTESRASILHQLRQTGIRVLAIIDEPFVYYKSDTRDGHYPTYLTGICFEIFEEILKLIRVKMKLTIKENLSYGVKVASGQYNGIIGELQKGHFDIAMAAISVMSEREEAIDFSQPYHNYRNAILMRLHPAEFSEVGFQFWNVLYFHVWLYILLAVAAVTVSLALLQCISPNRVNYNLLESFFMCTGSVVQGVTRTPPNRMSGRIVVSFWWMFCLMFLLAFVANYAALLIKRRKSGDINNLDDLLAQHVFKYGTVEDSLIISEFSIATSTTKAGIYHQMMKGFQKSTHKTSKEAVAAARRGNYAFLWDESVLKYYSARYCELGTVAPFDQLYNAFGISKDSIIKPIIDEALRELKHKNVINQIINRYYGADESNYACESNSLLFRLRKFLENSALQEWKDSVQLTETAGIFLITVFGCILSVVMALIEFSCHRIFRTNDDYKSRNRVKRNERAIELATYGEADA